MKSVYLAGKLNADELSIGDFAGELEQRGHEVVMKWWEADRLPTPYLDHLDTSTPAAEAMLDAVYDSDVAILFPSATILGASTEYGVAVASIRTNPDKQVIVVSPHETRQSVFYAHPSAIAVKGLDQIRRMDWF